MLSISISISITAISYRPTLTCRKIHLGGLEKWWKVVVDRVRRFDPDRQDGVGGVGVGGVFLVSACGA